jgi:hypothetical protein
MSRSLKGRKILFKFLERRYPREFFPAEAPTPVSYWRASNPMALILWSQRRRSLQIPVAISLKLLISMFLRYSLEMVSMNSCLPMPMTRHHWFREKKACLQTSSTNQLAVLVELQNAWNA